MKKAHCSILILALFCVSLRSADKPTERAPKTPRDYVLRGIDSFRAAKIKDSIQDFETAVRLQPKLEAQLWQLGISYYYAGEYLKGRRLFESHQKVNPQDVENAIWHFLCVAKLEGLEAARRSFISITDDRRVPMLQLHALFAGKQTSEDVLKAARAGEPSKDELKNHLFYANLYLGLYEEALGHAEQSLAYMKSAASEFSQSHYMGDVARVHVRLRSSPK